MFQPLYLHWAEKFKEFDAKEKDSGYFIIDGSVAMQLLNELYRVFMNDGVTPIEDLPIEKKVRYWEIAKKYYQIKEEAVMASKAAYVLDLITENE